MQLTKTELKIANDAATRSAGRAFSEMQDVDAAIKAARATAALNKVSGQNFKIRNGDVHFGMNKQKSRGGKFTFSRVSTTGVKRGNVAANSVKVVANRNAGSAAGKVDLACPKLLGTDEFSVNSSAVAMQVDRDISLVLDRSGSMSWVTVRWPRGKSPWYTSTKNAAVKAGLMRKRGRRYYYNRGVTSTSYQKWVWEKYYKLGDYPTSPWVDLVAAVDSFLDVLETTPTKETVSVASYASSASLDLYLQSDYSKVRSKINQLSPTGATAIGYGMNAGIKSLLHHTARPYAAKTMVVMTDGMHNRGTDPVTVAKQLVAKYNLTIHTVTFGSGADQSRMRSVAKIGGGQHYHAADGKQLARIFKEIANNLPVLITQ